jgi:hypothetical protein
MPAATCGICLLAPDPSGARHTTQVLYARDRFLAPGGAVLPDTATIYVAGGTAGATGLSFWDDVYGFSMAPVKEHATRDILKRYGLGLGGCVWCGAGCECGC